VIFDSFCPSNASSSCPWRSLAAQGIDVPRFGPTRQPALLRSVAITGDPLCPHRGGDQGRHRYRPIASFT
jgi:hypothetical protein